MSFFFRQPDRMERNGEKVLVREGRDFCRVYKEIFEELGRKRPWEESERVFTEERAKRGELEANPLFA